VAKVESLKKMLAAIFGSFTTLKDITIIMFFFYTLYAIAGQMVFAGNLKQQCFFIASGINQGQFEDSDPTLCLFDSDCGTD
jgi:hypothetical protein